jgi:hypothetical protein
MLIRSLLIFLIALGIAPASAPRYDLGAPNASPAPTQEGSEAFTLEFFPVAPYHVGDHLSLRVTYTGAQDIGGQEITIALAEKPNQALASARFSNHSQQAVFYWFLDTQGRPPGFLSFLLEVPEMEISWEAGLTLLPAASGRQWAWEAAHTDCCIIHYISGSDAEEDILQIQQILEDQTSEAVAQFGSQIDPDDQVLEDPLVLVLIPSVIGQGGFATDIAVMTYSDRNWAGSHFSNIAHHEIVHVLDRQLNDGPRPSFFAEGLAVYFAGGHYRDGDTLQRAAALLAIDRYIPIADFVDDFYAAQHEISYLEAGGLVAYLSKIWGMERFLDFYFNLPEADTDSASISSALEAHFGLTLSELEKDYIAHLRSLNPNQAVQAEVRLTIETYETMRRYQQLRVPGAYFRSAWWPSIDQAIERGIAGDYAPREKAPVEVVIENLFLEIYPALELGEIQRVEKNLERIQSLLALAEVQGKGFSHYSLGWPIPHPARLMPGY